ncbi:MAG: lipocalin family protein [Deltaproteobacteria bacterium]|nr:lipocalin family protein [Deltaproteobacteria bacterium]
MRYATEVIFITVFCLSCSSAKPALTTPEHLNLDAFMGTWHEVARLPLNFENNCVATSFLFRRKAPDAIRVESFCWYKHINGPMRKGVSNGYVKDMKYPGELMVHFMGPISYPYNVFYVAPDYKFAMLGSPDRRFLWILSRTLSPSKTEIEHLIKLAKANGFDDSNFIYPQESPYAPQ